MNTSFSIRGLFLLLCLVLASHLSLQAQDEKPKFGKPAMADLKMTTYDKDTSAEAVILSDIGSTWFDYDKDKGFIMMFDRFLRLKILTKDGYHFANFRIYLYKNNSDKESVMTLKGCTFNLVDKKVVESKLDNSAIFDEEADIHHIITKFTMPDVKEGSVIDVHYLVQSPFYFNLRPWGFQNVIPERYSEYEVRIPEYFHYKKQVSGYYPFFVNEYNINSISKSFAENETPKSAGYFTTVDRNTYEIAYRENIYRLATKDVPAMKEEKFTSSMINYHTRVEYELENYQYPGGPIHDLTSTWDRIVHQYLTSEEFGNQLKKTGIVKEAAENIKSKATDPIGRMVAAYDYIRTNLKWNKYASDIPTTTLRKAFSDGKGNSADINMLLILLLKELGLNADPVLLSTRSNGIFRESAPNMTKINYVIACADVGGKKYLLDATDPNRPYTMLPMRCLNGKGLLAIDDSIQWLDLLTLEKSNTMHFGEFRINADGSLEGKMSLSYDGLPASDMRDSIQKKGNDQYIRDLKEKTRNMKVDSVRFVNEDILAPLKMSYYLQSEELTQNNGNLIFFNVLFGMGEPSNPFTLEKREYPVDLGYPIKVSYIFVIDIPEGMSVESLPQKVSLALPDNAGTYKFSVAQGGNKITVSSVLNLTKTFYVMSEYPDLREFYTRMLAKQAEKIVLKKL